MRSKRHDGSACSRIKSFAPVSRNDVCTAAKRECRERAEHDSRGVTVKKGIVIIVLAALVVPTVAHAQRRSREDQRRRNEIMFMEGVLVQAVRLGAQEVSAEMEKFEPAGVTALNGTPQARGFVLDGYGVFFDVEIPNLNQSLVWSVMTVQRDRQVGRDLDLLRTAVESMPQGPTREQAVQALQQVSKTVGPATPSRAALQDAPPPGQVAAANTAPIPPIPMPDPDAMYTEAVKGSLIDAMLDHSLRMDLGAEEWLTVAARASDGPLSPAGLSDSITIILRVKGSDLAIYHADKTKRDEILQRVKVDAKVF
jgi:hypothetical protein